MFPHSFPLSVPQISPSLLLDLVWKICNSFVLGAIIGKVKYINKALPKR